MKNVFRPLTLMIVAASTLVACSKEVAGPAPEAAAASALSGTVMLVDKYGKLQADQSGVLVMAEGQGRQQSLQTGANGNYRFGQLPAGKYKLHVQKEGFAPYHTEVQVGQQPTQAATVMLGQPAAHQLIATEVQMGAQQLSASLDAVPAPAKGQPMGYRVFVANQPQPGAHNHVYTRIASTEVSGRYNLISRDELQQLGFAKGQTIYIALHADVLNVSPINSPAFSSYPAMQAQPAAQFQIVL